MVVLSANIVSAYIANNDVAQTDLPALISDVFAALAKLGLGSAPHLVAPPSPAVPIHKSVRPDAIICLEDGKSFKSLKRHLRAAFGMSPEQYRAKWGLPPDYPMVAPAYAEARSILAKSLDLGRRSSAYTAKAARAADKT